MIEDYYGHIFTREQRAELTNIRDKSTSKSSEKTDAAENSTNSEEAEIDLIKRQVLEELKAGNSGLTPEPGSQLYKVLFNGLVQQKLDERRFLDEHKVSPDPDLPDSLPD
jgi:Ran GTPase-activating protein (RanGAP) involved in mRNA processing and transport